MMQIFKSWPYQNIFIRPFSYWCKHFPSCILPFYIELFSFCTILIFHVAWPGSPLSFLISVENRNSSCFYKADKWSIPFFVDSILTEAFSGHPWTYKNSCRFSKMQMRSSGTNAIMACADREYAVVRRAPAPVPTCSRQSSCCLSKVRHERCISECSHSCPKVVTEGSTNLKRKQCWKFLNTWKYSE